MLSATVFAGCHVAFGLDGELARDAGSDDLSPDMTIADDLVAWYRMEGVAAGSMLLDESGRDNHATCTAVCPTTTPGIVGNALSFDGDAAAIVEMPMDLETSDGFTVAGWIRFSDFPSAIACPLSKVLQVGSFRNSWQGCIENDGRLTYVTYGTVDPKSDLHTHMLTVAGLVPGHWYHVTMVWTGTSKALFLDGDYLKEEPIDTIQFAGGTFAMGKDFDPQPIAQFTGEIDDVRIYRRPLQPHEIAQLVALRTDGL